jgi:hypothetical protein
MRASCAILADAHNRPNGVCVFALTPLRFAGPSWGRVAAQSPFVPPDANAGSRLNAEFLENVLHVFLDGARTAFQNFSDLSVALARNDPLHDFEFALGQVRRLDLGHAKAFRLAVPTSVPGGHGKIVFSGMRAVRPYA